MMDYDHPYDRDSDWDGYYEDVYWITYYVC
jgi:hypothetical protein